MSDSPYVEIVDVVPEAEKISAADLAAGDRVFDVWGNTHELVSVRTLKNGTVSYRRDDLDYREHIDPEKTITVIRGATDA